MPDSMSELLSLVRDPSLKREIQRMTIPISDCEGLARDDATSDEPTPPSDIGRYPILGVLGHGGSGRVYLGIDNSLRRPVAIKLLRNEMAASLSEEQIRDEGRMLASLNHPNLVTIHSLETAEVSGRRIVFLTLEVIEGSSLSERWQTGVMARREYLFTFRQIAAGLQAIHRENIAHRDLSPNNVRVRTDGVVKVLDFGLSVGVEASAASTEKPRIAGTPGYLSPEQTRAETVTDRTDIWSLGCLLYESITGRPAFRDQTLEETLRRTTEEEPDWDLLPRDLGHGIAEVLQGALEKEPELRPSAERVLSIFDEEIASGRTPHSSRTRSETSHDVPRYASTFVGRETEVASVVGAVRDRRLVTLRGPGGVGKSRLCAEAARTSASRFIDGAVWVPLASVSNPQRLLGEVATVFGVTSATPQSLEETLDSELASFQGLLVFDNCEHLVAEVSALVRHILSIGTGLHILTTSRQSLGLPEEYVVPVSPLPIDEEGAPSTRLFMDRARSVRPNLVLDDAETEVVRSICEQVDGLPLAIELAAARCRSLSILEIGKRLGAQLLTRRSTNVDSERHGSLQLSMEASHELLTREEQILFRRLSVFPSRWTIGAAEQVCADTDLAGWAVLDTLDGLVDKSMVEAVFQETEETVQYSMLVTLRTYAHEKLVETEDRDETWSRLVRYCLGVAKDSMAKNAGPNEGVSWARIDELRDTLDSVLNELLQRGRIEDGLSLTFYLNRYHLARGNWTSSAEGIEAFLSRVTSEVPTPPQVLAHVAAGNARLMLSQDARHHYERAIDLIDADPESMPDSQGIRGACLSNLGLGERRAGNFGKAIEMCEAGLELQRGKSTPINVARTLNNLASCWLDMREVESAVEPCLESLRIVQELDVPFTESKVRNNLGKIAYYRGDKEAALQEYERAIKILTEIDEPGNLARSEIMAAQALLDLDRKTEACRRLQSACDKISDDDLFTWVDFLVTAARLADRSGLDESAAEFYLAADRVVRQNDLHLPGFDDDDLVAGVQAIPSRLSVESVHAVGERVKSWKTPAQEVPPFLDEWMTRETQDRD